MTKNNRKRSNPPKKVVEKVETPAFNPASPLAKYKIKPISQYHANLMQDIVKLSNKFSQTVKQQSDREVTIQRMEMFVKKLENGDVKPPVMMKESENIFVARNDIKGIIKEYKHDKELIKDSLTIIEGQTSHWYDEYRDAIVRLYSSLGAFLGEDAKAKNVTGQRQSMSVESKKEEEDIFTKEFEKKVEDLTPDDKEKIKNAMVVNSKE